MTQLAHLPEPGTPRRKQIAAFVGAAPYCRDSGPRRGRRAAWGGRAVVRPALHRGTLVATLWNPALRQFHQSIMAAGKLKMLTLTECMRKLLTILNDMVKNGENWDPTLVTA